MPSSMLKQHVEIRLAAMLVEEALDAWNELEGPENSLWLQVVCMNTFTDMCIDVYRAH